MKTWNEMSGRERDALVAEKLFGWQERPCDLEETGGELTIYSSGDACCPRCGAYEHINSFEHDMMPPAHYTTSLDVAWQVVERFGAAELRKWPNVRRYEDRQYSCSITTHGNTFSDWGATPQEAICLAGLRASGYEIEKEVPGGTDNKEN